MNMVNINRENVLYYIDQGLIDPSKIKIDLNKTKTARDNVHRWVTLLSAIDSGYDFNFDYDVKEIKSPKVTDLPELIVTPKQSKLEKKINPYITKLLMDSLKSLEKPWYVERNFKDTFGVGPREVADWIPGVGDALALGDIKASLENGNYGEAALGAGMFVLPNIIEKPIRKLYKYGRRLFSKPDYKNYLKQFTSKTLPISEEEARSIILYNMDNLYPKGKRPKKYNLEILTGSPIYEDIDGTIYRSVKNINKVRTNKAYRDLFEYAPDYVKWANDRNLKIDSPETAAKFIDEYSYSFRGTVGEDLKLSKLWSEELGTSLVGDKLQVKKGIYSSNSEFLGKRYASYPNNYEPLGGVINKVKIDYEIDPTLPVIELLKELSKKSIRFDIFPNRRFPKVSSEKNALYTLYPNYRFLDWNREGIGNTFLTIHPFKNSLKRVRGYRFKEKTPVKTIELPFSSEYKDPLLGFYERGSLYPLTVIDLRSIEATKRPPFKTNTELSLEDYLEMDLKSYSKPFVFNSPEMVDYYTNLWKLGVDKIKKVNPTAKSRVDLAKALRYKSNTKTALYGVGTIGALGGAYYTLNSNNNSNNDLEVINQDNIYDNWEKLK